MPVVAPIHPITPVTAVPPYVPPARAYVPPAPAYLPPASTFAPAARAIPPTEPTEPEQLQFPSASNTYASPPAQSKRSKAPAVIIIVAVLVVALAAAAAWYFLFGGKNVLAGNNPAANPTAAQTGSSPSGGAGTQTATRLVLPGSCFELSQTVASTPANGYIWVVPCTQPHDSEVFANQAVTASSYPDDATWADMATTYCDPAFSTYVGSDMATSRLTVQYIRPTSQSWDAGNNQLVCFTVDPDGDRTSSVANSGE